MSTIRTIPPEAGTSGPVTFPGPTHSSSKDLDAPSTPLRDPDLAATMDPVSTTPPRSAASTPTTTATLTPNGRHRAIPLCLCLSVCLPITPHMDILVARVVYVTHILNTTAMDRMKR